MIPSIACLLLLATAPAPNTPPLVAIAVAKPGNISGDVERALRAALNAEPGIRMQSHADTSLGQEQAVDAGWKCDGTPTCVGQLAVALGVQQLVFVTVEGSVVGLQLVRRDASILASTQGTWSMQAPTRQLTARRWAHALLGRGGTLVVFSPQDTPFTLDGEPLVATPSGTAVQGLVPGTHVMGSNGSLVDVNLPSDGAIQNVQVASTQAAGKPWKWAVPAAGAVVAAGSGVVALVAAAAAAALAGVGYQQLASLAHNSDGKIVARAGESAAQVRSSYNLGVGLEAAGGVMGVMAGVMVAVALLGVLVLAGGLAWARLG